NSYKVGQMALWCPVVTTVQNSTYCDPFGTGVGDVSAYDAKNCFEGSAADMSTAYAYPLMLIYNQFSTNKPQLRDYATTNGLPTPPAAPTGGYGRRGATKIIMLLTDGAPNTTETATFVSGGATACTGYWQIRQKAPANVAASFELCNTTGNIGDNNSTVT